MATALGSAAGCGPADTGTGGSGGDTGGGGTGSGTEQAVNGCKASTAEDHTGDATVEISGAGTAWTPDCIRIKTGTSVTFKADFTSHPLVGGVIDGSDKVPDDTTPIASTSTGMEATFTFDDAGTFGFYCDIHGTVGMKGAVIVE
jgi:plastocyanin